MTGRPEPLFPLFASLETLDGVGPKTAQHFAGLGVSAPRDLIFTLPHAVINRQKRDTIAGAEALSVVTVAVEVIAHRPGRTKGAAYRVTVEDTQASFQLVFFHARGNYWSKVLPVGERRIVSGKIEFFDGIAQMVHPDLLFRKKKNKASRHSSRYIRCLRVLHKSRCTRRRGVLCRMFRSFPNGLIHNNFYQQIGQHLPKRLKRHMPRHQKLTFRL